jgi:hypothetical protein
VSVVAQAQRPVAMAPLLVAVVVEAEQTQYPHH